MFSTAVRSLVALLPVLSLGACADGFAEKDLGRALAKDAGHYRSSVKIKDDAFETEAMFSTPKAYQPRGGSLGVNYADEFLRGFIDKKTGRRSYQVYVILRHRSADWHEPYRANFGVPLQTAAAARIDRDRSCANRKYTGLCNHLEQVAFPVPEAELRRVQATATAEDMESKVWTFRLKNRSGDDYSSSIPVREVVALLEAMDGYRPVPMR